MWKRFYINHRFFHVLAGVGLCYVLAFFFPELTWFAHGLLCLLVVLFIVDSMLLFNQKDAIYSQRILPEKLSNGDENSVKIDIKNNYPFRVDLKIIDEIPFQFQKRDFLIKKTILPQGSSFFEYILIPKEM